VLVLLLIFLITFATLTVLLWAGTVFFQGYIYTEPSEQVYWQAPAAAGVLSLFLTLWCLLIANSEGASTTDIPYNTIFSFSPRVEKYKEAVPVIWVTREGEPKPIRYDRVRDPQFKGRVTYRDKAGKANWFRIKSLKTVTKDEEMVFEPPQEKSTEDYQAFVSPDGWFMRVDDGGPTGVPEAFVWGRFFLSLFLNILHLAFWFLALWLLLRFQWGHALGLGFVMWLIMTLVILPMLLEQAALVAQRSTAPPTTRQSSLLPLHDTLIGLTSST
jgi:hypothetical protein